MTLFKKAKPIDAMKHFALFLLALIIWGVMALSHVSAGSTAPSDIGVMRVAELKSADSRDSNAVEQGNFNIKVQRQWFYCRAEGNYHLTKSVIFTV